MGDARRRAGLVTHPGEQAVAHVARELQIGAQVLHRHVAIEHRIVGEQHAPHRALAEQAHDVVAADALRQRGVAFGHISARFGLGHHVLGEKKAASFIRSPGAAPWKDLPHAVLGISIEWKRGTSASKRASGAASAMLPAWRTQRCCARRRRSPGEAFSRRSSSSPVALALVGLVAYETGWLGWAWADALAHTLPKDESLLAYLPADTTAVAVIDVHLFKVPALGPAEARPASAIERVRDGVKKTLDLDLATDIDKLAITPGLVVARGRFSFKKLGDKLVELHYAPADHRGVYYFAKHGQDALAVVKDEVLLWGDEGALKAALDARDGGMTLDKDDAVMERLKKAGWKHAIIAVGPRR